MDFSDLCPYCQMPLSPYATHCPHCTQNIFDRWIWYSPPSDDETFRFFAAICSAMYVLTYMIVSSHGPGRSILVALATALAIAIGGSFLKPAVERIVCMLIVMPAMLAVCWFVIRYVLPFLFEVLCIVWDA